MDNRIIQLNALRLKQQADFLWEHSKDCEIDKVIITLKTIRQPLENLEKILNERNSVDEGEKSFFWCMQWETEHTNRCKIECETCKQIVE